MKIGCHLSSSGGYLAMAETAVAIGANVFQFFTRNPRGGAAKPLDPQDVAAFREYASAHGIGPILAHAPYTLNAAGAEARVREFARSVMVDDLRRLEATPGAMYNFHPGSHVGQGAEKGIELIAGHLLAVLGDFAAAEAPRAVPSTTILLETMAGKGSEVGRDFGELKAIIDRVETKFGADGFRLGVCLDTCHVSDGGYDIIGDLDGVLGEFDRTLGLDRLKAVHLNDSLNAPGSHKDRHAKIGAGQLGLEAIGRIINHPRLKDLPFYLETPCDLQGYQQEIALLKGMRK